MKTSGGILILLAFSIMLACFSACDKENVDTLIAGNGELEVDTVYCGLELSLTMLDSTNSVYLSPDINRIGNSATASLDYQWSDGSIENHLFVTSAGIYGLTITDELGCIAENTIEVTDLPCTMFAVEVESEDIDSIGFLNLYTIISGGTPPYVYQWSGGESSNEIIVMNLGVFAVTVTDSEGCTAEGTIEVTDTPCTMFAIEILTQGPDSASFVNLYTVVSGGSPPYVYQWSDGSSDHENTVMVPGVFGVTVIDSNGCTGEDEIEL